MLKRNAVLVEAGQRATDIFWVQHGCLRVAIWENDDEQNIRFGYPGNIITALDSHFTDQATHFSISAIRETVIRRLGKKEFLDFIHSDTQWYTLWQQSLQGLILQQMEREHDLLINDPVKRYHRVLERSPQLFQEVPAKYIANYLRMTPETLSRIRKS